MPVTRKMHTSRKTAPLLGLATLSALALVAPAPSVQAQMVVSPGTNTATEGNDRVIFPFNIGSTNERDQQVYNASDFSALSGPAYITTLSFRPDASLGYAFTSTLPDIQIDLSTTSAAADNLSSTFASNVGTNDTIVYNGALSLSSAFTGPAGGPKDFDITIPLQTPFLYNPAAGNLLLDVRNRGGGTTTVFDAQDATGDSVSRVYTFTDAINSPIATVNDSTGLVTQFKFVPAVAVVPESSGLANLSGALLALGLGGVVMAVKKKRRKTEV